MSGLENSACLDALSGTFSRHGLNSDLLMFQINGPLQMEHALLFTFLEASSDCKFKDQLHSLQSQQIMVLQGNDDDELQTDGNRSGHFRNGDLGEQAFLHPTCLPEHGGFLSPFPVFVCTYCLFQRSNVFSVEKLHCVAVGGVG